MAAQAFKHGAVDFIEKPFRNQDLLDQIHEALARDAELRKRQAVQKAARDTLAQLTQRETDLVTLPLPPGLHGLSADRRGKTRTSLRRLHAPSRASWARDERPHGPRRP